MSKLLLYSLLVIGVYVLVIYPLNRKGDTSDSSESSSTSKSKESKEESGLLDEENKDENGVYKGADGQLKYRIGVTN